MLFKNLLAAILLFCISSAYSQLQIVPQTNAQALAEKLLGPGVTISNVKLTGSPLSTAFFYNRGGTNLGIDSGIVLSTGRVLSEGVFPGMDGNALNLATSNTGTAGDSSLSALVLKQTNNAVLLEFDFIPLGDTVKFSYVFSSDEYPNYNCSNFNDVFAFFISGPGIPGTQNIALVPGTDIPVSINSINNGIAGSSGSITNCTSMGTGSPFVQYYVNNMANLYFTHNGHTVVLEAKSGVQPCQVYHLKIAIADVQDYSFDSGVFLEAESLRSDPIKIQNENPDINGQPYLVEGCHSGGIKIMRSRRSPFAQPISIAFGGNAVNGIDIVQIPLQTAIPANDSIVFIPITPIVDNLAEGNEVFKIYISNGCNIADLFVDSIEIHIRDYDRLAINTTAAPAAVCQGGSIQLTASSGYTTYQWSPASGLNNTAIANPVATPSGNTMYICNATEGNCHARDSVAVKIKSLELESKLDIKCSNGRTGEIRVSGGPEWTPPVVYNINNSSYSNDSVFTSLAVGDYVIKIKDASGCIDSVKVSLVQSFPDLILKDSIVNASCMGENGRVILSATGGSPSYSFAVDSFAFSGLNIIPVTGGQHSVHVKDANGCITSHAVMVNNDGAISVNTTTSLASCSGDPDGVVRAFATGGSGNYSFSVDAINFQSTDSFFVNKGNVTVTVRDDKGCTATVSTIIGVNETAFINAGNDTTICEGRSVQLQPNTNANIFSWNVIPGLSSYNVKSPVASPVVTSVYIVNAIMGICHTTDSILINVLPAPVANAGSDTAICIGRSISLHGSGGVDYSWLPASQVSDPDIFDPVVHPSASSSYYLQVTSADGCISLKYDTIYVQLIPAVQAFAGRDTSVAIRQPLQLSGKDLGNSGVTKFEWFPSTGLNNAWIENPLAVLDKDMTYQLTLTTPQGCIGTDFITIKVYQGPEIYVPGAFTPNHDGKNDILKPIPVGIKEFHYFRVFNRWGQMVFSTNDQSRGWDGTINGKKQSTGSFVWISEGIDYKGNLIQRKGAVSLLR